MAETLSGYTLFNSIQCSSCCRDPASYTDLHCCTTCSQCNGCADEFHDCKGDGATDTEFSNYVCRLPAEAARHTGQPSLISVLISWSPLDPARRFGLLLKQAPQSSHVWVGPGVTLPTDVSRTNQPTQAIAVAAKVTSTPPCDGLAADSTNCPSCRGKSQVQSMPYLHKLQEQLHHGMASVPSIARPASPPRPNVVQGVSGDLSSL